MYIFMVLPIYGSTYIWLDLYMAVPIHGSTYTYIWLYLYMALPIAIYGSTYSYMWLDLYLGVAFGSTVILEWPGNYKLQELAFFLPGDVPYALVESDGQPTCLTWVIVSHVLAS